MRRRRGPRSVTGPAMSRNARARPRPGMATAGGAGLHDAAYRAAAPARPGGIRPAPEADQMAVIRSFVALSCGIGARGWRVSESGPLCQPDRGSRVRRPPSSQLMFPTLLKNVKDPKIGTLYQNERRLW